MYIQYVRCWTQTLRIVTPSGFSCDGSRAVDSVALCPVSYFRKYLTLTQQHRGNDMVMSQKDNPEGLSPGEGMHFLFISSKKPFGVLSRERVRGDVGDVMALCGVDKEEYAPAALRGATVGFQIIVGH